MASQLKDVLLVGFGAVGAICTYSQSTGTVEDGHNAVSSCTQILLS